MKQIEIRSKVYIFILLSSFVFFMIKGVTYIEAGSYAPIVFVLVLALPITSGLFLSKDWALPFVRIWAMLMMLFGIVRITIEVAFYFTPSLEEVHIREQFTLWFNIISVAYIIGGFYLFRNMKSAITKMTNENC